MQTTRYLIIGGGMTGDAAVKGIREHDTDGRIVLVVQRLLLLLFIAFAQPAAAADDPTRRQFDPDPARQALSLEGGACFRGAVMNDRTVPGADEPANHVRPHAAESDHANLHQISILPHG